MRGRKRQRRRVGIREKWEEEKYEEKRTTKRKMAEREI